MKAAAVVSQGGGRAFQVDTAVTVFVPAYNEAATLADAVADVRSACAALRDHEVIIVDDGSADGTGAVADQLARMFPNIRVIHNPRNLGLAAGYRIALAEARMPFFTFVPGDREVSQESIGHILAVMGSADIVVPYHANTRARPWHRRLLTWASTSLINFLFGLNLRYYQGPCVYPTALARSLPTTTTGFFFLAEMLLQAVLAGHSVVEVGLIHQERTHGRSRAVSLRNILTALATLLRLWWAVRLGRAAGPLRGYRA
jgi:glycosyltransferase involved in cell wall biosynthesis